MGILVDLRTKREHHLTSETVVGRSRRADLCISEKFVSSLHASLSWQGQWWELKDLGSHNGTAVAGRTVPAGTRRRLKPGDEITFGQAAASWTLSDASAPRPLARSEELVAVGDANLLVLPSPETPELSVMRTSLGKWQLEADEQLREVADNEEIELDGRTWKLRLPSPIANTSSSLGTHRLTLEQALLTLEPTPGSEAGTLVRVRAGSERLSFPLGAGSDLMRELAAARGQQQDGWVEREALLERLSITHNHLNVAVFRVRRLFADAGFSDAASIIERRRGRLRLGTTRVELANG